MENMPWAITPGRPTDVAHSSFQWMGLKSPAAPAYLTRSIRSMVWSTGGTSSPVVTCVTSRRGLMPALALHRRHPSRGQQPVAGEDRTVVAELLLTVDDAPVVQPELRVVVDLLADPEREHDREGRDGRDVRVAGRAGGFLIVVDRIGLAHGLGELAELLTPDLVPDGGVLLADQGPVQWHGLIAPRRRRSG